MLRPALLLLLSFLFMDKLKGMEEPNLLFVPLSLILLQSLRLHLENSNKKLENREDSIWIS